MRARPPSPKPLRLALVTGIFPPDIGGPATHVLDLQQEFVLRGHQVTVVTLWDGPNPQWDRGVVRFPRRWPWPVRLAAVTRWIASRGKGHDLVYATGLQPAAAAGARIAGLPLVAKVVGDPAWERAARLGLTKASFESFQRQSRGASRAGAMRWLRDWSLLRADSVVVPSRYLSEIVKGWAPGRLDPVVIPNGVRLRLPPDAPRQSGTDLRALCVSRLVAHKHLNRVVNAVASLEGVTLDVVGDGPERASLEAQVDDLGMRARINFHGSLDRDGVARMMGAADVLVGASSYEGLPHVAIEALVSGTPIVSPPVGGMTEVLTDRRNGLVVDPPTVFGFTRALARLRDDPALRETLAKGAEETGGEWTIERCADQLESLFQDTVRRPRAVFLGKSAVSQPPGADLERKFGIMSKHVSPVVIATGVPTKERLAGAQLIVLPEVLQGPLGGAIFYSLGPIAALFSALGRRPSAVVCQSPFEAVGTLALARLTPSFLRPRIVVEVHGDWRTAATLYGSPGRSIVAPAADAAARWAIRRADRVRVVSAFLKDLVGDLDYRGSLDSFPAYSNFDLSTDGDVAPLPNEPRVAFVGRLDRAKGVDVLLEAWSIVSQKLPEARLAVAGEGPLRQSLVSQRRSLELNDSIAFLGSQTTGEVKDLLDRSFLLVLPSRSEGMGRVILEAFSRGRPVVASRVGGIPGVVEDGVTGILVPPEDPDALAEAIAALLQDREKVLRMGAAGRRFVLSRSALQGFESGIERLAGWIIGR
jgi:glycosyltransferase involved in cell wall biosynthesis